MRRLWDRFKKWWKSRIRKVGKENHIRLYPNPGFALVFRKRQIRWNRFYGWRVGKIRR